MTLPVGLFLLFVGLKLTGVIAWPWLWITAPLWIPLGIGVVCYIVAGLTALIALSRAGLR